jgi:hypothetical protein
MKTQTLCVVSRLLLLARLPYLAVEPPPHQRDPLTQPITYTGVPCIQQPPSGKTLIMNSAKYYTKQAH